jgi:hypothetical protein
MVTDNGLVAANPDSVTVRVPYAFGVACTQNSGWVIVSLLPADSASYFSASIGGYAWRGTTGSYLFKEPATVSPSFTTFCGSSYTNPPVKTLSATGWSARAVYVPNDTLTPPPGTVVYLYQLVRYAFAPSAELPGRIGLWRTVLASGSTVSRNELVAPFDTSASFQFLDSTYTPHATPPANLNTVKGLRLLLVAASETAPEGRTKPVQFNITTDVVFRNHP